MSSRIPFALPDITDAEVEEVTAALRSGWVTSGPRVRRFEEEFATAVEAPYAVAVNSATSGLHLALEAAGVRADQAVLVPAVTFVASAEVVRYLGAHPVLADVDPTTGLATADTFRRAADRAARRGWTPTAIMPVHLAGQTSDLAEIGALASQLGASVVEDAAHAFPASFSGAPIGSISDFTVFSFYATKTLTTGEGGMVTSANQDAVTRMRTMRLHGISTDAWDRYNTDRPSWEYDVVAAGFKYNMTDVAAAMGLRQLQRSEELLTRRRAISDVYTSAFEGSHLSPLARSYPDDRHAWHLFVVRVDQGASVDRDTFIEKMAAADIGTSVHFIPLYRMQYYRTLYDLDAADYPGAEEYFASCVSLPIYSTLSDHQVARIAETSLDIVSG